MAAFLSVYLFNHKFSLQLASSILRHCQLGQQGHLEAYSVSLQYCCINTYCMASSKQFIAVEVLSSCVSHDVIVGVAALSES